MDKRPIIGVVAVVAIGVGVWAWQGPAGVDDVAASGPVGEALVEVILPASLNEAETMGKRGFDAKCAACHGENAAGRNGVAPPLVHRIYEPSHHGDMAFVLAVQNGVQRHHWPFGNMPPVEGLTQAEILNIVAYVRALQAANGI